jgi:hypothetical protein
MSIPEATTTAAIKCAECGRDLECCAFCDREDCPAASCYSCLVAALHEYLKQPHRHGG